MLRALFVVAFGGMAYLMAAGAQDWNEAMLLAALPLSAGLASVYLAMD